MLISAIPKKIYEIRGQNVILDFDLAEIYGVQTKVFKQAVKRNLRRFPPDFMFTLTQKEFKNLRSQIVTSSSDWGGRRYAPTAFTELGVSMLSSILNSEKAIQINILIMRIFVMLRQYGLDVQKMKKKIDQLERKYDKNFMEVFKAIEYLVHAKSLETDFKNRERIGFKNK